MTKHYKLGGSTAERTLQCELWLYLLPFITKFRTPDVHANTGTLMHSAMELYYTQGYEFEDLIDNLHFKGIETTEYHVTNLLTPARDMVDQATKDFDWRHAEFERTIEYNKDIGGTADILALSGDKKTLSIVDYKFGTQNVKAGNNSQFFFYAFLALEDNELAKLYKNVDRVNFVVIQPRVSKNYKLFTTTRNAVKVFKQKILRAFDHATSDKPKEFRKASVGDWCYFCPCQELCHIYKAKKEKEKKLNNELKNLTKNFKFNIDKQL